MATIIKEIATKEEIMQWLLSLQNDKNAQGMKRFGIKGKIIGVSVTQLRQKVKEIQPSTSLALSLWREEWHEARMLATMLADKNDFTSEQMDSWTEEFASWDITDGACFNLFRYLPYCDEKIFLWAKDEQEFVRRSAFSLIAGLAVGNKKMNDDEFLKYLPLIRQYSFDDRNFVWKAVHWALRQIGKRNKTLYPHALALAQELLYSNNKNARKIGSNAFRELSDQKVILRIK